MILLIFVSSISLILGNLRSIQGQDNVNPSYNTISSPEPLSIQSISEQYYEESEKDDTYQPFDKMRNMQKARPMECSRASSNYRKNNDLKVKTISEVPSTFNRNKENLIRTKNEFSTEEPTIILSKNQIHKKKKEQFDSLIVKSINKDANEYEYTSEITFRSEEDLDHSNINNLNSSRRFLSDKNYKAKPSNDIEVRMDYDILHSETKTKSEELDLYIDNSNKIHSNDITTEDSNKYKKVFYDNSESRASNKDSEELDKETANRVKEPIRKSDISEMKNSRMIMQHTRVCYACSSLSDPTCWSPDRNTLVKYCSEDHISCLTKIFQYKDIKHVIRDCGNTCTPKTSLETNPVFTSCTTCHYDLCNGAYTTKIQVFIIIVIVLFHMSSF